MAKRHFVAVLFVDCYGSVYSASQTDQAGKRGVDSTTRRTRCGRNLVYIGTSAHNFTSKPKQAIIKEARFLAACRDVFCV